MPVVLYNVPGRTGVNIAASTTLRLARDFENIIAVKEASGNMSQIAQWIYKVCDRWRYCKSEIELVTSGMQRRVNKTTQTLLHKGLSQLADIFRSQ